MKTITLKNGPACRDGQTIQDRETVLIKMAIYRKIAGKTFSAIAVYEPDEKREAAYWSHNEEWLEVVATIDAGDGEGGEQ